MLDIYNSCLRLLIILRLRQHVNKKKQRTIDFYMYIDIVSKVVGLYKDSYGWFAVSRNQK